MKKLGLIVNPIAGMGGKIGLKGTDGEDVLRKAIERGAEPESPRKAVEALKIVSQIKDEIELITYPGDMGEEEAREGGFSPTVIGVIEKGQTTSDDTRRAAKELQELGVDLLLFAGGDGTARDVYDAIGMRTPALGIPVGVKMFSGVFAMTPKKGGEAARKYLLGEFTHTKEGEVMDIDEEAYREGGLTAKLYGYLTIPEEPDLIQTTKSYTKHAKSEALVSIASEIISKMDEESYYVIGPGTTTKAIKDALGVDGSLLGVDVVLNRKLVARDVSEGELLDLLDGRRAHIVVTIIGGQGYIFGRGNQQLSPSVIRKVGKDNIIIVATSKKLLSLNRRPLVVDTGDDELDRSFSGYAKVFTGFRESHMYRVGY